MKRPVLAEMLQNSIKLKLKWKDIRRFPLASKKSEPSVNEPSPSGPSWAQSDEVAEFRDLSAMYADLAERLGAAYIDVEALLRRPALEGDGVEDGSEAAVGQMMEAMEVTGRGTRTMHSSRKTPPRPGPRPSAGIKETEPTATPSPAGQ